MTPPITRMLNIGHFPPATLCVRCGHVAGFEVSGKFACCSQECDPHAEMWFALDQLFRTLDSQTHRYAAGGSVPAAGAS